MPDTAIDTAQEAGPDGAGTPSCLGLAPTCGPAVNGDCCASNIVPGGTFNRSNDPSYPAIVSDFRLDTYEVTVGRFERVLDWSGPFSTTLCNNCANLTPGSERLVRGGSFPDTSIQMRASMPIGNSGPPSNRGRNVGARCARDP